MLDSAVAAGHNTVDGGIGSWITRRAFFAGDRIALVDGDRRITYSELDRRTDRLAHALGESGVRQGDRVAVLMTNSAAFLETLFAVTKLGAVFVPINFRLAPPEVAHLLADSGADVLVWTDHLSPLARAALAGDGVRVRTRVVVGGEPADGELPFEELLASGEPRPTRTKVAGHDLFCLMYTSGTTGRPKGAMLTHDNFLWNVINILSNGRGMRQTDRTVAVAPMFHIGGLGAHTLPLLYVGGTSVIMPSFDAEKTLAAMVRERVTLQFLVPAMWSALMALPDFDSYDLSALELAMTGAAPCPRPVLDYFLDRGVLFREAFGMTETGGVTLLEPDHVKTRAGTIGRPLFHVHTRVVDEQGHDVPLGEVGELVIRGPNVFAGYWGKPEATAEAFRGGWFHSGDLAHEDAEGFLTLIGRSKDMIISGGENIYPIEVEQVLVQHPAVGEVAVVGVPHTKWGETPIAVVVRADGVGTDITADDLMAYARENLAHFKCPTRVEFLTELPRNAGGKVLKTTLRSIYGASEQHPQGDQV